MQSRKSVRRWRTDLRVVFGWERHHEHHNTTASAAFHRLTCTTATRHLIHCQTQTLSCCSDGVMLTVETCAALFTDKRQTKTAQCRANAAGWAAAKAAPATQVNEHLIQSEIEHRAKHVLFQTEVVGAKSQKMAAKCSNTHFILPCTERLSECVKWQSALSGFHMFCCNFLSSQYKQELRNTCCLSPSVHWVALTLHWVET